MWCNFSASAIATVSRSTGVTVAHRGTGCAVDIHGYRQFKAVLLKATHRKWELSRENGLCCCGCCGCCGGCGGGCCGCSRRLMTCVYVHITCPHAKLAANKKPCKLEGVGSCTPWHLANARPDMNRTPKIKMIMQLPSLQHHHLPQQMKPLSLNLFQTRGRE